MISSNIVEHKSPGEVPKNNTIGYAVELNKDKQCRKKTSRDDN